MASGGGAQLHGLAAPNIWPSKRPPAWLKADGQRLAQSRDSRTAHQPEGQRFRAPLQLGLGTGLGYPSDRGRLLLLRYTAQGEVDAAAVVDLAHPHGDLIANVDDILHLLNP